MRSSAIRLTLGAAAWIVLGAAAFLIFRSEQEIIVQQSALRSFDQHAQEANGALSDLRASQLAYVASGQSVSFWVPKVASTLGTVTSTIDTLHQSAHAAALTPLEQAAGTMTEFVNVDKRARDYLKSDQSLMASDVIFTEGNEATATAARQIETARLAEHQVEGAAELAARKQEALLAAGAGVLAGGLLLLLIPVPRPVPSVVEQLTSLSLTPPLIARPVASPPSSAAAAPVVGTATAAVAPTAAAPAHAPAPAAAGVVLKAAASLATDFGRLRDVDELSRLLGRASDMMDASGVIVWMGDVSGADLRPVLAHGYTSATLARIKPVPRTGDNAAAAAYRSGALQIVQSRPGGTNGAVVAPILAADGCIGALSAETRGGGESSDRGSRLCCHGVFASHLAGVLATSAAQASHVDQPRAANS